MKQQLDQQKSRAQEPQRQLLRLHKPQGDSTIQVDEATGGTWPFGPARTTPSRPMPYPFVEAPQPLPRPPGSTYFFEALDRDEAVRWWKNKVYDRWEPIATSKQTFACKEACAIFVTSSKRFFITKKKESPGEVVFKDLPERYKKLFRKSRDKEIESLLKSGAIKILSLKDSREFLQKFPEYVLTSRYVDRWKPTGSFSVLPENWDPNHYVDGGDNMAEPKSRWCVVGWKDPHVHEIERAAPTPLTSSLYLFFQLSACRRWQGHARDAKTAFLQARPTTRQQKLACKMPADECFPQYHPDQLILLLTEVYGLVSGPAWWRRSLLEILVKELGYRVNPYDRCILTLDDVEGDPENTMVAYGETYQKTKGIIVIEVDDILEAGEADHRKKMEWLESKLRFGKIVNLMEAKEGTGYAGRRVRQLADFSFTYSMDDYVRDRLKFIKLEKKVLKKDAATQKLTADEEQQLRGALASLNWTVREGRPDASAAASIYAASFPGPTVANALAVNNVIGNLKEHKVSLKIHALQEEEVRHLLIADSSFDPSGKTKPQHGFIQAMTTPSLNAGAKAPVSWISWTSKRLRRKAGNTLLCESIAMSSALGAMEKQVALWRSITRSHFKPSSSMVSHEVDLGLRGPGTVIASEAESYRDPLTVALTDAKSLFDGANPEQAQGEDARSSLEIAVIQESLAQCRGRLRWIPHNRNPSDALTKVENAHCEPLLHMMSSNHLQIEEEAEIIAREKQGEHRRKTKNV